MAQLFGRTCFSPRLALSPRPATQSWSFYRTPPGAPHAQLAGSHRHGQGWSGHKRRAGPPLRLLRHRKPQQQQLIVCSQRRDSGNLGIENRELLVGDVLCLVCFCLYKQITALIFLPSFPGWLAPLHVNPDRLAEFLSFTATLCGTWVGAGMLAGNYRTDATQNLATALARTSRTWLGAMPVCAANLVLVTAVEGRALVGAEGFADVLPLAASGPGEPFVTAAGVLGLVSVWRAFYAAYLDVFSMRSMAGAKLDRGQQMQHFAEALRSALLLSLACCIVLQYLGGVVGEEELEAALRGVQQSLALGDLL